MKGLLSLSVNAITNLEGSDGSAEGDALYVAWKIIRNFVNMAFILMLVVIAFGTIFNTEYGAKNNLFKLLIAALLVNFSLLIGMMVIDISNVVAASFINSFGGAEKFVDRIMQTLQPQSAYTGGLTLSEYITNLYNRVTVERAVLNTLIMTIAFTLVAIFATLVGVIIIFMRIPFLWIILIFSPLAWAALVFPGTRKFWNKWWKYLIDWSFILPIYIFFMYLGVFFYFNAFFGPRIEQFADIFNPAQGTDFLNLSVQKLKMFFNFMIAVVFMVGGGFAAKSISGSAGNYTNNVSNWMGRKIRGAVADRTGVGVAWKQFKATGQVGSLQTPYGGERAKRMRQARGRDIWQPGEYQKQQSTEVKTQAAALARIRQGMTEAQWAQRVAQTDRTGIDVNSLAMKEVLAKEGLTIDTDGRAITAGSADIIRTIREAGGDRTMLGERFLSAYKGAGSLSEIDDDEASAIVKGQNAEAREMLRLRQTLGEALVKKNPKRAFDVAESMYSILPTGEARNKFIRDTNWEKATSSIKLSDKRQIIEQIRAAEGVLNEVDFKKMGEQVKKQNPALWEEARRDGDPEEEVGERFSKDTPKEMRKYIGNMMETNATDVISHITSMSKTERKVLVKDQTKEFLKELRKAKIDLEET